MDAIFNVARDFEPTIEPALADANQDDLLLTL